MIKYEKINRKHVKIICFLSILSILMIFAIINIRTKKIMEISDSYKILCKNIDNNITANESDYNLDKIKIKLANKKKYSELETLNAIEEYKRGNVKESIENLNLALEHKRKNTNYISTFYTYKYLFIINKEEGNYEKAKINLIQAIKSIPKNEYNNSYEEIGSLVKYVDKNTILENIFTESIEKIIGQEKYISDTTELYLREKIRTIYITNNQYAEATNSLIKSITIANEIGDKYSLTNAMISLGIVYEEIGGYKKCSEIIEGALDLEIEDNYEDAYIKTFGYLNLADVQISGYKNPQKAISILENIEKYREFFKEEDFRDIEIYKLIYESNAYILEDKLDLAKTNLKRIQSLITEDKNEFYLYKDLEYKLSCARYFYACKEYKTSFDLYDECINEYEKLNEKSKVRNLLREVIPLYEKTDYNQDRYYEYVNRLIDINQEIQSLRYFDYSLYVSNSIEEQKQTKDNYVKYINSARIGYLSIIGMLVIYIYSNKKIKKLKYLGEYDGLTNVYNRKKFDMDYKKLLSKSENFACIIMDIDNFKKVNDTYGHGFGDIVLKNVSKKIKNILSKNYNLYRYGGEEFVILGQGDKEYTIELAEKIRKAVEQMNWQENIRVTVSIGISFSDENKDNVLGDSDKKLYQAKNTGKNKIVY